MNKHLFLIWIFLFALYPPTLKSGSQQDDWEIIYATDDSSFKLNRRNLQIVLDPASSIKILKGWIKEQPLPVYIKRAREKVIAERKSAMLPLEGYSTYSHTLTLYEFDCMSRRVKLLQILDYNSEGTVLESVNAEEAGRANWRYVVPESRGENILSGTCASIAMRNLSK